MKKTTFLATTLLLILLSGCGEAKDDSLSLVSTENIILGEKVDASNISTNDNNNKHEDIKPIKYKVLNHSEVLKSTSKNSIQQGLNFIIHTGIKKGNIIGKIKSDKFDIELVKVELCGKYSYLFHVEHNGNLIANCDIKDDFKKAILTIKATVKKPNQCYHVEEKIVIQVNDTKEIADTTKPVITLKGESSITLTAGDIYTEQGATATDNKDGDITSKIETTGSVDTSKEGTYTVTYSVSDKANNTTTTTRTIIVNKKENKAPSVEAGKDITVIQNETATLTAQASDSDGKIVSYKWSENSNTLSNTQELSYKATTLGVHTLTITVTDNSGATATDSVKVTVTEIADTTKPVITLKGESSITLTAGDIYTEQGATATDNKDGDITSKIETTGSVDTSKEGTYTITYSVSDTAENSSSIKRTIIVNKEPKNNDDYPDNTYYTLKLNEEVTGEIEKEGDKDYFKFTLKQKTTITLETQVTSSQSGELIAYCNLIKNSGGTLEYLYRGISREEKSSLQYTLDAGSYSIIMWHKSSLVSYSIKVAGVEGEAIDDDYPDSPYNAYEINLNSTIVGSIEKEGDEDFFKFTLGKKTNVSFERRIISGDEYVIYNILKVSGFGGQSFFDSFIVKTNEEVSYDLEPGDYYIRVGDKYDDIKSKYEIKVLADSNNDNGNDPSNDETSGVIPNNSMISSILQRHNYYRHLEYNGNDMVWDDGLANDAKSWAVNLAKTYTQEDQDNSKTPHDLDNKTQGENIAWSSATMPYVTDKPLEIDTPYLPLESAVDGWASEKAYYDYDKNGKKDGYESEQIGHYTQLVWKKSTKIGCAKATSITNLPGEWVVCRYSPAGNMTINGVKQKPY